MRINTSEFVVENKILAANENEVIYDMPRQRIEEAWDKLSVFYTEKSLEENKSEVIENEFYIDLINARVENETVMTAYDLIQKNVINRFECLEPKESKSNIKKHILNEVLSILNRGIEELKENIQDESSFYMEMKSINSEIIISDRSIKISTDLLKYIEYEEFCRLKENKDKNGLFCSIKFNGIELKGFHSCERFQSVMDCSSFIGNYTFKGIEVSIKNEFSDIKNDVITSFIEELYCGKQVNEIISFVPVLFSRYFVFQLTADSIKKVIIETDTKKQIDGLSSTFYVLTDKFVLKVIRGDDFKIFYNGELVKIQRLI